MGGCWHALNLLGVPPGPDSGIKMLMFETDDLIAKFRSEYCGPGYRGDVVNFYQTGIMANWKKVMSELGFPKVKEILAKK